MAGGFTESVAEQAALAWLEALGYAVRPSPDISLDGSDIERGDYSQVVLERRLRQALFKLNPSLPTDALDEAFRKLIRPEGPTLVARNHTLHRLLVDGVTVEYRQPDGSIAGAQALVLDFDAPDRNDWLQSTSLPWWRTGKTAALMWSSLSTACHWRWWS
jgi:type I restriction enzyme, R subunit